jgi:hypothetical protein
MKEFKCDVRGAKLSQWAASTDEIIWHVLAIFIQVKTKEITLG